MIFKVLVMQIQLNNDLYFLKKDSTIIELLTILKLVNENIAVAVNKEIVPLQRWTIYTLHQSDKVDIVHAIGGG